MYKMTPLHKRKIGEAVKRGKISICIECGKQFYLPRWLEKREFPKKCCSRTCFKTYYKKYCAKQGEKNYFWKNGSLIFWKRKALKLDINNLRTLCPNCHRKETLRAGVWNGRKPYGGK